MIILRSSFKFKVEMLQKCLNVYGTYLAYFQVRKTGWDRLDQFFIGLGISKILRDWRLDCGCGLWRSWEFPVLGGLSPVQSRFFCSLETGLPSTNGCWDGIMWFIRWTPSTSIVTYLLALSLSYLLLLSFIMDIPWPKPLFLFFYKALPYHLVPQSFFLTLRYSFLSFSFRL